MAPIPQYVKASSDFPPGPLTPYRNMKSFDIRKMQVFMESEDLVDYKGKLFRKLEQDPLFKRCPGTLPIQEERKLTTMRANRIHDYDLFNASNIMENPLRFMSTLGLLSMYDPSTMIKYVIPAHFFHSSVVGLGSRKHAKVVERIKTEELRGCYALTEVAHGTNAKRLRTTATFDPRTQEFILHTPDFEAAKCWVGNLGCSSTHATVFAQLYTPDGVCHGMHGFITPLRDPQTMLPYPGVVIGDMGEKLGLDGVDNGFALFSNYRIPKDALLDRTGSVSEDGSYISPIKDPRKRFGASLGSLVAGRICVVMMSMGNLIKAVCIAIRYSSARRQFGPTDGEELPVIEYQLQQWRLFPHLASAYALSVFALSASQSFVDVNIMASFNGDKNLADFGVELHALMSAAKPLTSWAAQTCIQESREACGGHGYLTSSGLGSLRNDNDANCTYEGDNNVLMQQSSNWLLALWKRRSEPFSSPLGSVRFLYEKKAPTATPLSVDTIPDILSLYEWLICWLLEETEKGYQDNLGKGQDPFTAKNNCQVFLARSLSLAYIEHYVVLLAYRKIQEAEPGFSSEVAVFTRLIKLYGLSRLQTHIGDMYEGGLAQGPALSRRLKEAVLRLCDELRPDAISLVDAIAPPDFILNSAIGKADGEIYKNIQAAFMSNPDVTKRPHWWRELTVEGRSRL